MLQLRIVARAGQGQLVRAVLRSAPSANNLLSFGAVAEDPPGELFVCDLAAEDADAVIAELQALGIPREGSIVVQDITLEISRNAAEEASAVPGTHEVTWESVESATSEATQLSPSYLAFVVLSMLIAASGILLDTPILIVGAMIVGPDFGPLAGSCVAVLERRPAYAARSFGALLGGYGLGLALTALFVAVFRAMGVVGPRLAEASAGLSPAVAQVVGKPGFFSFFVAFCAGIAGMLSLSTAKSAALIGVLVSVTTIPAAANTGLALAYGDWRRSLDSLELLLVNLATLLLAGTATLLVQRRAAHRTRRGRARTGR